MYEMGKFMVYKFTVQFTATLLSLTIKLKVYSTLDSLQQIVATYKSLTGSYYNFALLVVCFSTNQRAFYTVYMYKKNMLLRNLAFIALLLMELAKKVGITQCLKRRYKSLKRCMLSIRCTSPAELLQVYETQQRDE